MFGIGPMELMAILVVALLVFGPKRLPELARTLGRGLGEFRRASNDLRQSLALDELQRDLRHDPSQNQTIHRPDDRPAQAGDDALLPKKSEDATKETTKSGAAASSDPHPGELPLGDEHDHAHHELADAADSTDKTQETQETQETEEPGDATGVNESDDPKHANSRADSELGNVPVSGTKPTDPQRG